MNNDTFATADEIPFGDFIIIDSINGPAGDTVDYFTFTSDGIEPIEISLTNPNGDLDLRIYDEDQTLVTLSSFPGVTTVNFTALPGEVYYIEISGSNPSVVSSYVAQIDALFIDPEPDLIITDVALDSVVAFEGSSLIASATTENIGAAPTPGEASVELFLSTNEIVSIADFFWGFGTFEVLTPRSTGTVSGELTIDFPDELQVGTYYYGAQADAIAVIDEVDETNNGSEVIEVTIIDADASYVEGSNDSEFLAGTFRDDYIEGKDGAFDLLWGGFGADVFVWGDEHLNDTRDFDVILDYQVGVDTIDINTAEIAFSFDAQNGALIGFEGGDLLFVSNTLFDDLTLT